MKEKYLIVTLIRGWAEKYHQNLRQHISDIFNTPEVTKRKSPSHITLKYTFYKENIKPIEDIIYAFCKQNKKSTYKIKGINHFTDEVIFLDVIPSKEMTNTYYKFIKTLKNKSDLEFKEYDGNTHFHASLGHTDIKDRFNEIWEYLKKENPDFDCEFDNITLLKLVDGIWKIEKEFVLK